MKTELKAFLENLQYWLKERHDIVATFDKGEVSETVCDVSLRIEDDDEDEDGDPDNNFYVGSFAEPGLRVEYIGKVKLDDYNKDPEELVRVNGIVFSALGKHVAGWVVGFD